MSMRTSKKMKEIMMMIKMQLEQIEKCCSAGDIINGKNACMKKYQKIM